MMEDFFLSVKEHKVIKQFKKRLETSLGVKIYIPDEKSAINSDVIFGSIYGNNDSIQKVQKFLKKKINKFEKKQETRKVNDVLIVTLSDSECSTTSDEEELDVPETFRVPDVSVESNFDTTKTTYSSSQVDDSFDTAKATYSPSHRSDSAELSSSQIDDSVCILESTRLSTEGDASVSNCVESAYDSSNTTKSSSPIDDSVCIIECTANSGDDTTVSDSVGSSFEKTSPGDLLCVNDSIYIIETPANSNVSQTSRNPNNSVRSYKSLDDTFQSQNDSICIIGSFSSSRSLSKKRKNNEKDKKTQEAVSLPSSTADDPDICEVSSTTEQPNSKKVKFSKRTTGKQEAKLAEEFIPLSSNETTNDSGQQESVVEVVIPEEPEVEKPPRRLRPIIIDGSNIAREHGRATTTFSSKGIQLCINYFLERGHTQVTVFLPKFRKHSDKLKFCPTTDSAILDELEKKQYVVYTPSRFLNGKILACYDDRFMVQLAAKNGGVLVSNDNFKDLAAESPSYKEVIETRLLMYCFVGDSIMIPDDPLGRDGPKLAEFLSFPPDEEAKE